MTKAKHTPGPWGWYGDNHAIYLATTHSGRQWVMGFERMGMQGAQPSFQEDKRIKSASELVRFEVGDGTARGFKEAKANHSVYRYNICEIDHPDARLIAAAPDLLEALEDTTCAFDEMTDDEWLGDIDFKAVRTTIRKARAAIAKAKGEVT